MRARDYTGNRQAESGTAGMFRARWFDAHIGLEYAFQIFPRDTRPPVFHPDFQLVAMLRDRNVDMLAAISPCVIEQVGKAAPQGLRLCRNRARCRAVEFYLRAYHCHVSGHAFQQGVDVELLPFFGAWSGSQEFQRTADHVVHFGKIFFHLRL